MIDKRTKEIRKKGFEFFKNNGRMPIKLLINKNEFNKLSADSKAIEFMGDKIYFDDLEIVIDNNIKELEIR